MHVEAVQAVFREAGRVAMEVPMEVAKWDWSDLSLDPRLHDAFSWRYGITPFTNVQCIVAAWVVYGVVILGLKSYMADRQPFKLRYMTAAHNLFLCVWSLLMVVVIGMEAVKEIGHHGFAAVFCLPPGVMHKSRLHWGLYLFYVSKFYELIDTVILVLKKRPIIFLHWYHHMIVIAMVWTWLHFSGMYSVLGALCNAGIHVFMYYYYMQTSLGRNVWYKRYITRAQIVQFGISFLLCIPYFGYVLGGYDCRGHGAVLISMTINGTFLALFISFYASAYGGAKKARQE